MHLDHLVPVGLLCLGESLVEQDAGVVDKDIGAAKVLDGVVEHRLPAGYGRDIGAVGDRPAAVRQNRIDDLLRHRLVGAGTVAGAAEVIDHDGSALACKQLCVGFPQPAASPGDQRNLAIK